MQYPIDDCGCPHCLFVYEAFGDLNEAILTGDISPWSIATVAARWLGTFVGFHSQPDKAGPIADKLAAVLKGRALQGVVESATMDAEEATKQ